jgi:hypothetical protein
VACGRTSRVHAISFGMQICFQAGRSEDPNNKARQRTTSTRRKQDRREPGGAFHARLCWGFSPSGFHPPSRFTTGLEIADCE